MKTLLTITLSSLLAVASWAGELPGWSPVSGSPGCASCNGGRAGPLDVATLLAIDFGPGQTNSSVGTLVLQAVVPSADMAAPNGLEVIGQQANEVQSVYDANHALRQISTWRLFINIATNSSYSYTIRVMTKAAQGAWDSGTGSYAWDPNPQYLLRQFTVENPDASSSVYNRLQIQDVTSGTIEWMCVYSDAISGWTVTLPDNLGSLKLISTNQATNAWTLIRRHLDASGQVVDEHSQVFTNLTWGPVMLSDTWGAGSAARTRQLTYYPDAVSAGYTPTTDHPAIQTDVQPDGTWRMVMAYDTNGLALTELYGIETGPTSDDSQCRKIVYSYASQDPSDDLSREPESPRKILEYWKNTLVKCTYHVYTGTLHRTIECPNPANLINDSGNLVTEINFQTNTTIITNTIYPDGTASIPTTTVIAADGTQTNTIDRGQYDPNSATIVNGTRTVDVTDAAGALISHQVWRLSGGVLQAQIDSAVYTNFDGFDRPQQVNYPGGLYETMTYACCGLASKTDKDGATTTYGYDDLGRQFTQTRLGITLQNMLDVAGRVVAQQRIGTNNSVILLSGKAYDTSGFTIAETNALFGVTTFARTKTAAGYDIVTTTYPNNGTRAQESNGEGLALVRKQASVGTRMAGTRCTRGFELGLFPVRFAAGLQMPEVCLGAVNGCSGFIFGGVFRCR